MKTMYSEITVECKAYELCFAHPDPRGINSLDDLRVWEIRDRANRRLFILKDVSEAEQAAENPDLYL